MANYELFHQTPEGLQQFSEQDRMPFEVVQGTSAILNLYFGQALGRDSLPPAAAFIQRATKPYLNLAGIGMLRNIQSMGYSNEIAQYALQQTDVRHIYEQFGVEADQAFRHSIAVMGVLPDRAQSAFLPKGFSRRGMLRPPVSARGYLDRLHEMKSVLGAVAEGRIVLDRPENNMCVWRTKLYFDVASDLPMYLLNDKDILTNADAMLEQIMREYNDPNREERIRINQLLGDLEIDL